MVEYCHTGSGRGVMRRGGSDELTEQALDENA